MFGLFVDWCIQQTWYPVVHIVVLGTYLIYLYRVEVLLWKCVHFKSTCPWVSHGDIVQVSLCKVWIRFAIPPLPGVSVKCHNFVKCANLTVLTRMKHPNGLVIVDFNVSVGTYLSLLY